jgi:hypothetical protein
MPTQKDLHALIDTVLAFELRIVILELFIMGQQCLYAPRIKSIDSPRLLHLRGSCCFDLRVVDFNPSNCPLLAMPSYHSSHSY